MMLLRGFLCAAAMGYLTTGCSPSNCDGDSRAALRVTVLSASGEPVCNARVVARSDRAFEGELRAFPGDVSHNCSYGGANEEAGTFSLEVTVGANTKTVKNIKVTEDDCHPLLRDVAVTMDQ